MTRANDPSPSNSSSSPPDPSSAPGAPSSSALRLDHFLKIMGKVRSGGEAKHRIQGGEVLLNGAVETHRSRKLKDGDVVVIAGESLVVDLKAMKTE